MSILGDELRKIADRADAEAIQVPAPSIGLTDACGQLRKSIRKGRLEIEIDWEDYEENEPGYKIAYKVANTTGYSYKTLHEGNNLAEVVRKACEKQVPADTLDRLEAAMGDDKKAS